MSLHDVVSGFTDIHTEDTPLTQASICCGCLREAIRTAFHVQGLYLVLVGLWQSSFIATESFLDATVMLF